MDSKTVALNKALNPRGPAEQRAIIASDHEKHRQKCIDNAWHFLHTGESIAPSAYGGEFDRDYNPNPYPEAKPKDIDMYMGTGIGLLYRILGADHMYWELAGWNLVRSGAEQRARRK